MRKSFYLPFACLTASLLFGKTLIAQVENKKTGVSDPSKEYVLGYIKSLERFITNPDSFFVNGQRNLQFYENKKSKTIFNFLSSRNYLKGYISGDTLYKEVVSKFPDGVGILYNPDSIVFVGRRKSFSYYLDVYKTRIEYSGIRKDGSLISYEGNQYFSVKSLRKSTPLKMSITSIADDNYFKKRIKKELYWNGLFLEPIIGYGTSNLMISDRISDAEYGSYYWGDIEKLNSKLVKPNFELNIVYMLKPSLGFGTGISGFNTTNSLSINYRNIFSYVINANIENASLGHLINIRAPYTPVFTRFQFGFYMFSLSFDIGAGVLYAPKIDSYLLGKVTYNSINKSYDYDLVHEHKVDGVMLTYFARPNLHIHFSNKAYLKFSFNYTFIPDIDYTESWHEYDMFAVNYSRANEKKRLGVMMGEIGMGFNLNEIFLK